MSDAEFEDTPQLKVRRSKSKQVNNIMKPSGTKLGMRRPMGGYNPSKASLSRIVPLHAGKRRTQKIPIQPKPLKLKMDPNAIDKVLKFKVPTFLRPLGNKISGALRPGTNLGMRRPRNPVFEALHDPEAPDAIILYVPKKKLTEANRIQIASLKPGQKPDFEVEVVIDPVLSRVLRPHQIEGVKFLYECTNGLKAEIAFGCIMADEMV